MALTFVSAFSLSGAFSDPSPLEEVVVYGAPIQRTELDTVASISVVDQVELEARNIRDIYDLLLRAPNLNAATEDKFSMRGISNQGVGQGGVGRPTVSIFVDGVRQSGRGVANAFDVAQVEVYRGPQSTAFGPGSLAGAIVVNSVMPQPGEEFNGRSRFSYGSHNSWEAAVALGFPIYTDDRGEGLAGRISLEQNHTDDNITNITRDDDTWQERTRQMLRGKVSWYKGIYTAHLGVQKTSLRAGPDFLAPELAKEYKATDNQDGHFEDDTDLISLRQTLELSDEMRMMLLLSSSETVYQRRGDYDISEERGGYFINDVEFDNQTAELRFNLEFESFKGVAGLYYSEDFVLGITPSVDLPVEVAAGASARTDSIIGFGRDARVKSFYTEFDYNLNEAITLTAGGRYEENSAITRVIFELQKVTPINPVTGGNINGAFGLVSSSDVLLVALQNGGFQDVDETYPNGDYVALGKLGATWHISDDINLFLTRSEGYRAGGVDFVVSGEAPPFGPETTENYDLGLRIQRDGWNLAVSLFDISYEDMQVGVRLDATTIRTDNVGSASARGAELEIAAFLPMGFSVDMGLGYVKTKFEDYVEDGTDFAGNEFPLAANFTGNIGLNWNHAAGWYARINYSHADASFTDRANTEGLMTDSRNLWGARLGYQGNDWEVSLTGRNLTDQVYITDQIDSPSVDLQAVIVGDPREIALEANYRF
ncbi:outer membrane receptor protein involved in Fe transport [Litorivivens lipolytica]|uniref:Outer membrane receptor protein involved in Fe transport n=1 Tax=Litorivivens lipolytica TaxID=1524264 RepID=A0A7W4Z426_9GAMM|nr:outer membrane receptor protein involved in Fe transport [Litorivivens lipolytica]